MGIETKRHHEPERATPAMGEDILLPFTLPSVGRKKLAAAFDGGRLTSDGGVMLLSLAKRRIGLAHKLAAQIADTRVIHPLPDILRARILARTNELAFWYA